MNFITRPIALACLACTGLGALANTDEAAPQRITITAPRGAQATVQEVLQLHMIEAAYEMSSGRKMKVATSGGALRVRYGRRPAATLTPDSSGSFVSADGNLALQFELDKHADTQSVRLTLPAEWQ